MNPVAPPTDAIEIKLVGVGGIGTSLLPFLARYLQHRRGSKSRITLVDGDSFERSNETRQEFPRLGNKAAVKAEELAPQFTRVSFRSIPAFVSPENITGVIVENDVVLLAVDNFATRRLVSRHCQTLGDVALISGGNEFTDGNVQVYVRRGGADLTHPLTHLHPEIADPEDLLPTDEGCERLIATSAPQLLFTNLAVGSAMLSAFYALLESGEPSFDELYLDIPTGRHVPIRR